MKGRKRLESRYKRALILPMRPHWWRCFWEWPFGHVYEIRDCKYCGRPLYPKLRSVTDLEVLYEAHVKRRHPEATTDAELAALLPPRIEALAKAYHQEDE